MDLFLLQAVAAEVAARLVEREVLRVSHLGGQRYLLRFATQTRDNLLVSVRPELPRIHLLTGARRVAEVPPDAFSAVLDNTIGGSILAGIQMQPWDRVVKLVFRVSSRENESTERHLVVELLGRSANALLLDPGGVILAHARTPKSRFRTPVVGEVYRHPPGRDEYQDITLHPESAPVMVRRFGEAALSLRPISRILMTELEAAGRSGSESALKRLRTILDIAHSGRWRPVLYSSRPLERWSEGDRIGREDLIVSPMPLEFPMSVGDGPHDRIAIPFASPSEAATVGFGLLERLREFDAAREHHLALAVRETARLTRLLRKLEEELERSRGSDRHRKMGEALLAGLATARVEGETAIVPDPYDATGPPLEVPINPTLPLQENARVFFDRYKKGKRGIGMIETRLRAVRERLAEWLVLADRARQARSTTDIDALRAAMDRLGLVHAPRPKRKAPSRRAKEEPVRVRRIVTRDGFDILVGKDGRENDTLTFKIASPWDFWLHAADRPGAHVVVRNPRRLKKIPEGTLRTAAEMAAFYSGARKEGKVEVHFTQRKHVLKRKGMASGQVLLRRHSTIHVTPRLPRSTLEEV